MKGYTKKIIIGVMLIIFSVGLFGFAKLYAIQQRFEKQTGLSLKTTLSLIFNGGSPLITHDNRINILLLGMGGGDHEGGDLTDTIIVASISTASPSMKLISIPRDIWSDELKDRINSAYHYGEVKEKGSGLTLAKKSIGDIIGMTIPYSLVFDFFGFTKLIDLAGGINVNVTKPFVDKEYPIAGKEDDLCGGDATFACRYETIQFESGISHMDGATALKYVRSRHADGDEGTDFARGERQQDIIIGLKQAILLRKPWFHPTFALQLLNAFDESSDMDMSIAEVLTIGKLIYLMKDMSPEKISIEPMLEWPSDGDFDRYVLVPVTDFQTIREYIKTELAK